MADTKHEAQGLEAVAWMDSDQPDYITTDPELADKWVENEYSVAPLVLLSEAKAVIDQLRERVAELEGMVGVLEANRPHWAMGYSKDSIAAQCATSALSELWGLLGVTDQTSAVAAIDAAMGSKGDE